MTNRTKTPRTGVPQHVLMRLAARAVKVVARHGDKHGALASYAEALPELTARYAALYQRTRSSKPARTKELDESQDAMAALRNQLKAWSGLLRQGIPGLEMTATITSNVPDDMLHGTDQILLALEAADPLPFRDRAIADLTAARETLAREWSEAQTLLAGTQEEQAEVRRLAAEVQAMLVGLRRTLRVVLGREHRDYQKLRLQRARTVDEEDVEVTSGVGVAGDPVVPPRGGEVDVVEVERDGDGDGVGEDGDGDGDGVAA